MNNYFLEYQEKCDDIIARNRHTDALVLDNLYRTTQSQIVQYRIASHRNTSSETLKYIVSTKNPVLLEYVAGNMRASQEVLEMISEVEVSSFSVSWRLVSHPNCTDKIRAKYVRHPSWEVRHRVAETTQSSDQLIILSQDIHSDIRLAVAVNRKTPKYILETLIRDQNQQVSRSARSTLKWINDHES